MKKGIIFILVGLSLCLLFGCATVKVDRLESNEIVDLSGDWNAADSQITAKDMINECLGSYWRDAFFAKNLRNPTVIVGTVKNRSQEHINVQAIVKDLETALINSGKVTFVASKGQRQELRDEKADQAVHSSADTKKAMYQETGADFMLQGQINTIFDEYKGKSCKYYQTELELINIKTNEKVWMGQKKIQKLVKKKKLGI